jgi:hypothetical protein
MKHSIRAYRGLCREVGILSEAALAPESSNTANGELLKERWETHQDQAKIELWKKKEEGEVVYRAAC